jgi:(2Fe-2S) ferredoxin
MDNIIIIDEKEKAVYKFGESKIFYRRISPSRARIIREMHTKDGRVDQDLVTSDSLQFAIVGWSGIKDPSGNDVAFSPDLLDKLPYQVRMDLTNRIVGGTAYKELEGLEKN